MSNLSEAEKNYLSDPSDTSDDFAFEKEKFLQKNIAIYIDEAHGYAETVAEILENYGQTDAHSQCLYALYGMVSAADDDERLELSKVFSRAVRQVVYDHVQSEIDIMPNCFWELEKKKNGE